MTQGIPLLPTVHTHIVSRDPPPKSEKMEKTVGNALSEDEIQIILKSISAISRRDTEYLYHEEYFWPPKSDNFWNIINFFGKGEFVVPKKDDIMALEIIQFDDGRGYVVDIDLPVKGAREGEVGAVVITFEIIRKHDSSFVGVQGAYW